jgi:LysR family transcriptional regulator, nod-box dependent transcriptional activator
MRGQMDLHGFDLNLLVALDALLAERSVTNAGRRVHLSQSAMSGVLARLRDVFGDELLVPARGGMVLTPLAEHLVEPVRVVLLEIQQRILTQVPFDPSTTHRSFTVAASDYAVSVLLAPLLRNLRVSAPTVSITIAPLRDRVKQLEDAHLDLLIVPDVFVPAGRPHHVLFRDTFSCIASAAHPTIGETLTLEQYAALGHVVVSFVEGRVTSFDAQFGPGGGLQRRVEVVAPSYQVLPDLVIGTDRIATIQTRLARRFAATHPIKVLALPAPLPTFEEAMVWHERFDGDEAHAWFRAKMLETGATLESEYPAEAARTT